MRIVYIAKAVAAFLTCLAIQFGSGALAQSYSATATTTLNYRAGPGTGYEVIGSIPAGGTVTVYGCTEGYRWCDIGYSGQRGWASGKYLAYAGGGQYYGYPLFTSGIYLGLPIFWNDYPIYRPGGPGYRPPGARPPRPTHPIARPPGSRPPGVRPPGNRPPGVRPPRPTHPVVRPPRPSHPAVRPPSYSPRPGVGAGGRPGGGYRGGGGGRGGFGGGGRGGGGRGGGRGR